MVDLVMETRLVRLLIGLLVAVSAVSVAAAQAPPATKPAERFEVASIRPNPGTGFSRINTEPGGRYLVVNFPLVDVILSAFDLRSFQLVDVPRWVQVEKFDIVANTGRDEYLSVVAMRPLIRTLLAERFQLEVSREQRDTQTYALVRVSPDKLGPQITPSTADCSTPEKSDPTKPGACGIRMSVPGAITARGSPLNSLARFLIGSTNTFVDDETGLPGAYDFTLKWNPTLTDDTAALDRVSVFTALQEQLGLRLEPRRKPVEVVAIKRIERPTEN
jgi:uncharacterized protein (TIGR03435 family)